jgi:precorrin-3B C17-methyltransferase
METVLRRLRLAADADFVIALYNPASKARPTQIHRAFAALAEVKPPETVVIFARAVGRPDEALHVTTLGAADLSRVDMATLVFIGSSTTRLTAAGRVYTSRYGAAASALASSPGLRPPAQGETVGSPRGAPKGRMKGDKSD